MSNTIKSAKLLSWQPDCCRTFESMPKGDTLVICSQRQVGKSFTCAQILLYVAINNPKSVSIYISPTNDSSRKFFGDIKSIIENSPLTKKVNESILIIEFFNGSKLIFRSAESKLRGYSCKNNGILIVDEAQYVPEDIWEVVLPFTNVDNSKRIFISTPRFKNGQFYKFYTRAVSGDKGYHLISTSNYDTSMFLSEAQKAEYKIMLSPQAFKSEILGQWLDNGECIFGDYQSCFYTPDKIEPVTCGIDWSTSGNDDTILTGFNSDNQMCILHCVNNIPDPVERAKYLASVINRYPTIKKVVCETNSIGSVYISILKRELNNKSAIVEFTTTNDSKKRIIERCISLLGQKQITLLPDSKLDLEFSAYEMQQLKNGNYTYNGHTGVHDDIVMSVCFALEGISSTTGHYRVMNANRKYSKKPHLSDIYG